MSYASTLDRRNAAVFFAVGVGSFLVLAGCAETFELGYSEPAGTFARATSAPAAGGVRAQRTTVDMSCDTCANGIDNCGNPCGPEAGNASTCGGPGQCGCSLGGSSLVGFCASNPASSACTYCAPGTSSNNPCSNMCKVDDPAVVDKSTLLETKCPAGYALGFGQSSSEFCCPINQRTLCPGTGKQRFCADKSSQCPEVDDPSSSSSSGSSGGSGSCSTYDTSSQCTTVVTCPKCSVASCSNGPCGWVRTSDGNTVLAIDGYTKFEDVRKVTEAATQRCGCGGK